MVQTNIPFLNGKNFRRWRVQMKVFLEYQELLEVVEKGIPPLSEQPTESELQAFRQTLKNDRKALCFIHQSLQDADFERIESAKTANEAWKILQTIYESGDVSIAVEEPNRPSSGPEPRVDNTAVPRTISGSYTDIQYLSQGITMHNAAVDDDWSAAENLISENPGILSVAITHKCETALHIAVAARQERFVMKLVQKMNGDDLEKQNDQSDTAFCLAAVTGDKEIARVMMDKNARLPMIRGKNGLTPIHLAALRGHRKMVVYLYDHTYLESLGHQELIDLFHVIIAAEIYDIALKMLQRDESLALSRSQAGETALHLLARKPCAIARESPLGAFTRLIKSWCKSFSHDTWMQTLEHQLVDEIWKQVMKLPDHEISAFIMKPSRLLFDAAALGNAKFLRIILRSYPKLIWEVDRKNRSLFHVAAINRRESIFYLLYELGALRDAIVSQIEDGTGNTMLHLVGNLPPSETLQVVPGAALQMQRELFWFETVRRILPISCTQTKNDRGEVAWELFIRHHSELRTEGEKWMKRTAASFMLVATLVATVVFQAAFSVPGGLNEITAKPNLLRNKYFDLFVLFDALALSTSSLSILFSLAVIVSRYSEADFVHALPLKLVFGLHSLGVSLLAMLIAFGISTVLLYEQNDSWIPIFNMLLISTASFLFLALYRPLLWDIIRATIRLNKLRRSRGRRPYPRKHPTLLSRVLRSSCVLFC